MTILPQHRQREGKCLSPKTVPLREEFVALTQDPLIAIVLNQLLYWTQRVKDFDLFLKEECFFNPDCNVSPRHGWIYKTANELIVETMTCVDRTTMRRYLKFLMDRGWLEERSHPKNKWDKTSQYRLNLRKLQEDLLPFGFELPGIEFFLKQEFMHRSDDEELISEDSEMAESTRVDFAPSRENFTLSKGHTSNGQFSPSSFSSVCHSPSNGSLSPSMEQNAPSNVINSPLYIQRIQTETKNREQQLDASARGNFSDFENSVVDTSASEKIDSENSCLANAVPDESVSDRSTPGEPVPGKSIPGASVPDKSVADEMLSLWERHVVQHLPAAAGNSKFQLTVTRKDQLESLFAFHFQNDIRLWERFCLRVKASNFLMGGGESGWHVRLDWILREGNASKVLEGKYDNSKKTDSGEWKLEKLQANPVLDAEKAAILASIKDPIWRKWCSQLAAGVRLNEFKMLHEPLAVLELQQIAHAWFLEVEDDRLVWIGSRNQRVLNKIDYLRLKINWVFAKEHPNARTFRTRLEGPYSSQQTSHTGETHA